MNEPDFELRLQQCLDERRDPIDDPQLVAWLDAHPERLAEFAALRDDVFALTTAGPGAWPTPQSPAARHRLPLPGRAARRVVVLAIVSGAAAVLLAPLLRRPPPSPPVADPAAGRILNARVEGYAPRLYATAHVAVREALAHTPTLRLEIYRLQHHPR